MATSGQSISASEERSGYAAVLLRRLMITCPATGRAADTGFELSAIPDIGTGRQWMLVDCLECGQDHPWQLEDTFMDAAW